MLLATTGSLGAEVPPESVYGGWVKSPGGLHYQAHDLGNVLLMWPAAWLGAKIHPGGDSLVQSPPITARVGVSLTYACLSAFGCLFMFKLLSLYIPDRRTAFLLSLTLPAGTFFWVYAKCAFDVQGAACAVCLLLYSCARLLEGTSPARYAAAAAAALGAVGLFRLSLVPFMFLAAAAVFLMAGRSIRPVHVAASLSVFALVIAPALLYNAVRMGSPFRPATTAQQFLEGNNALTGSVLVGLTGLLIAPNRGLIVFAPLLALSFSLPWVWRRLPASLRQLLIASGSGAILYMLLISKLRNWGAFGWGPRYLVPILPVFFLAAVAGGLHLPRRSRPLLACLLAASIVLCTAPVLVNWHLATTAFPGGADPYALLPRQHMAVWTGLAGALRGEPLPAPPEVLADPIRSGGARFPDLWLARLMERSATGLAAGVLAGLMLAGAGAWSLRGLLLPVSRQAEAMVRGIGEG